MLNDATRDWMINHQIRPWNVFDPPVLAALAAVRREDFLPTAYRELAFAEAEIPLPQGQRMLKPLIEGRLLTLLDVNSEHTALLVGTGSGFLAACLAQLVSTVTAIDCRLGLTDTAIEKLAAANVRNVECCTADFHEYKPGQAFDRILVTGSLPEFDTRLIEWLKPAGQLIVTVGNAPAMQVERVTRQGNHYSRERLFETVLQPLDITVAAPGFRF